MSNQQDIEKKVDEGYEIVRDRVHLMAYLIMGNQPQASGDVLPEVVDKSIKAMKELRTITAQLSQLTGRGKWTEALAILEPLEHELPTWSKVNRQWQRLMDHEHKKEGRDV